MTMTTTNRTTTMYDIEIIFNERIIHYEGVVAINHEHDWLNIQINDTEYSVVNLKNAIKYKVKQSGEKD